MRLNNNDKNSEIDMSSDYCQLRVVKKWIALH